MQLQPLIEEFLTYLEVERGYSRLTVRSYRSDLAIWRRDLAKQGVAPQTEAITVPVVRQFVHDQHRQGLAAATIARRLHCLRSFWSYLLDFGYVQRNPAQRVTAPKKGRKLPRALSRAQCEALLEATGQNHYELCAVRDKAVLATLIYTGLRRAECLGLRIGDVNLQEGWLRVVAGKGNECRVVPLVPELVAILQEWLETRPQVEHDRLFTDRLGRRLGHNGFYGLFHRAAEAAGLGGNRITPHKLRHSFATMLLTEGCDLVSIARLLGHRDLQTTALYLQTDHRLLRAAVSKHPMSQAESPVTG